MTRTLTAMVLALTAASSPAATNTALLSRVTCDFAFYGHGEVLARQADGKILVGGDFSYVNGQSHENLARLTPDGALDTSWKAEVDGSVDAIVVDGDHVYVAGYFTKVNGTNRLCVVRLRGSDGGIDTAWDAAVNSPVNALAVDDTHVYLGGSFSTVGGEAIPNLARVDKLTGAVDTNWVPEPDDLVHVITLDAGYVYVGGGFGMIGTNAASNLARVSKVTGAMDTAWLGSAHDFVSDLALDGDKLYVAGDAPDSGSYLVGGARQVVEGAEQANLTNFGLARLDLNTGLADTNWNPRVVGCVYRIAVETSVVYAVGSFTRVGSALKRGMARIDKASGEGDQAWGPGVADFACNVMPEGPYVYVVGGLRRVGTNVVSGIARLDAATGNADLEFRAYCEEWADMMASALQADGSMIVGGRFSRVGGVFRDNLVRIDSGGTVDPLWAPNPDLYVMDVALDGSNIYAAGWFSEIGGRTRVGIARLNAVDGSADLDWESPLGALPLLATRSAGRLERHAERRRQSLDMAVYYLNSVRSVVVDGTGVYIGGYFVTGGTYPQYCLAKLSKVDGSVLPEFDASLWDGYPFALALDGNHLYVGGDFEWIGGQTRFNLARLSTTDGTADPAWDPDPDSVADLIAIHDGKAYVSGSFMDIGGVSNTYALARLNLTDGAADPGWLPLAPPPPGLAGVHQADRAIPAMGVDGIVFSGSNVVLAGMFQRLGGDTNIWYLGRVSADRGVADSAWVPTPNGYGNRLLADGSALYVFGDFDAMAGASRLAFAKLFLDVPCAPAPVAASKAGYTDKVDVSWNACPGAEVYELWRGSSNSFASALRLAGDLAVTNYSDASVSVGARYYYWVRGTNGLGTGAFAGPDYGWRRSRAALCGTIGDYDGDGRSDLAAFDEARALWYAYSLAGAGGILAWDLNWGWGAGEDVTVVGDYDGDRLSDWCVYHPPSRSWYVLGHAGQPLAWNVLWGGGAYAAVPGDYDGDERSDLAVYAGEGGRWYIWSLAREMVIWEQPWGWSGGTPVPGDYDGDGTSDLAVYDPEGGNWYVWSLTRNMIAWAVPWGGGGMIPVPGDYDGDGTSDLAVYDSAQGLWYAYTLAEGGRILQWAAPWGMPGLIPIPGDFDGDGISDWAVHDTVAGQWYVRQSSDGAVLAWGFAFGGGGLMPVTEAGR